VNERWSYVMLVMDPTFGRRPPRALPPIRGPLPKAEVAVVVGASCIKTYSQLYGRLSKLSVCNAKAHLGQICSHLRFRFREGWPSAGEGSAPPSLA